MIKNFTTTFEWLRLRKDFMLNMDRIQRKMAVQFNTYECDLELSNCYNSIVNDIKKIFRCQICLFSCFWYTITNSFIKKFRNR